MNTVYSYSYRLYTGSINGKILATTFSFLVMLKIWNLKIFYKIKNRSISKVATFNIEGGVCKVYYYLSFDWLCLVLTTFYASIHHLDWYCLPTFKKRAGTGRRKGGCITRENFLSVMNVIYWWPIVMIV